MDDSLGRVPNLSLSAEDVPDTLAPDLPPRPSPEDGTPEVDAASALNRALLCLQTALADATRAGLPAADRQMESLVTLLDDLPRRVEDAEPEQKRHLAERLVTRADRLQRLTAQERRSLKEEQQLGDAVGKLGAEIETWLAEGDASHKG